MHRRQYPIGESLTEVRLDFQTGCRSLVEHPGQGSIGDLGAAVLVRAIGTADVAVHAGKPYLFHVDA